MARAGAHIVVTGRVQGVGFRDFTAREARQLGLSGTVRNASDGDVRVYAEGERQLIENLIARLRRGPSAARVRDVQVSWLPAGKEGLPGFSIEF